MNIPKISSDSFTVFVIFSSNSTQHSRSDEIRVHLAACWIRWNERIHFLEVIRLIGNVQGLTPVNDMQHQVGRFALNIGFGQIVRQGRGGNKGKYEEKREDSPKNTSTLYLT